MNIEEIKEPLVMAAAVFVLWQRVGKLEERLDLIADHIQAPKPKKKARLLLLLALLLIIGLGAAACGSFTVEKFAFGGSWHWPQTNGPAK